MQPRAYRTSTMFPGGSLVEKSAHFCSLPVFLQHFGGKAQTEGKTIYFSFYDFLYGFNFFLPTNDKYLLSTYYALF